MISLRPWAASRATHTWGTKWTPIIGEIEDAAMTAPLFGLVEERFKQIAARCFDATRAGEPQSLAISSATSSEGKSSVAIGVALASARNLGSDVLLVEADMQAPTLADDFRLDAGPGLADYLNGSAELNASIRPTRIPNVWLLPAGRAVANPGPLIRSLRFAELMGTLHRAYRTIIVDAPALLTSPHAGVIVGQAQSLVLVVRAGRTHVQDAAQAARIAPAVPVQGVVLNGARAWLPGWIARLCGVSRFAIE